jgi:hypothetical protein
LDDLLTGLAHVDERLLKLSPIVIIGMHRSGTRLLVDVLDKLGVFMGADRQADSESVTFMLINEGILHQCGAFWSEPMSAHFMLAQPDVVEAVAASVREALAAQLDNYAGRSGWHLWASANEPPAFGWKDPRNTFTLPVWKHVFPRLRVIHIVRHGVDAAASLSRRHAQALRAATGEPIPSALAVIRDHALGILSSRRGWTLPESLTMWEQYVEKARKESAPLGDRAPRSATRTCSCSRNARFRSSRGSVMRSGAGGAPTLLEGLDPSRAFAFRRDPELVAFAGSMREVLALWLRNVSLPRRARGSLPVCVSSIAQPRSVIGGKQMSQLHIAAVVAMSALALPASTAFAQVFVGRPGGMQSVPDRSIDGRATDADVYTCAAAPGGSRVRPNCEVETDTLNFEQEIKFLLKLNAPPIAQCGATTTTAYQQLNTIARVTGTLTIADCVAAASGAFTVAVVVKDDNGEERPLEFSETWQRSADSEVSFAADYPIGENVELVSLRLRDLICTCGDPPKEEQASSED